jgi:gliotoxin/aspirochlorine/mycotoxins biosynthesis cytochrome P450 monooxygenase
MASSTGRAPHAVSAFMKFPFFLTAGVVYGEMNEEEERELWDLAQKHMALLPYFVIGGPYRFSAGRLVDRTAYRKLNEYQVGWRDCHERMVARRRAAGVNVPLLSYWDEYEAGKITSDEVIESVRCHQIDRC